MTHKELAHGRWFTLSLAEQLGNVGSEYERATTWKLRGNTPKFESAFERFLELLDLTVNDPRTTTPQKRELLRARESACDELTSPTAGNGLSSYFMWFALRARRARGQT